VIDSTPPERRTLDDVRRDAHILIVDDEPANVALLRHLLDAGGYRHVHGTSDSSQVLALVAALDPDLLLLDLHMPWMDGFQVLDTLRCALAADAYLPVVVLTADFSRDARQRALAGGAKDFVTKPFDATEVLLRVNNLLETRALHLRLLHQNDVLEERVRERTRDVEQSRLEMLHRLGSTMEFRDNVTHDHTVRVGKNAEVLALEVGLSADDAGLLRQAAPLHDIGKIGVPDHILMRPDRLTPDEFEQIKAHTVMGARLLSGSTAPVLQLAETIAFTHHEQWDGSGYEGMQGEEIPLASRIVSVADVFDALTHARPYKKAWPIADAIAEIERQAGHHFDPAIVVAFGRAVERGTFQMPLRTVGGPRTR